jgi:dipeptidase
MEVLADHYEGTYMYKTAHDNPDYRTTCNKRTVSAMVAQLRPETPSEMQVMWYCMSSPCIGIFIPVYANISTIPVPYLTGSAPEDISNYDDSSAWWAFKKIQLLVDEDYDNRHAMVRAGWAELYNGFVSDINQFEQELQSLYSAGEKEEARSKMDSFVEQKLTEAYDSALQTIKELTGAEEGVEEEPSGDMPENGDEEQDNKIFMYLGVFAFIALIAGALLFYVARAFDKI